MNQFWVWLSQLKGVGPATQRRLLTTLGAPEAVYHATMQQLLQTPAVTEAHAALIRKQRSLAPALRILQQCRELGLSVIPLTGCDYPSPIQEAHDAPIVLYAEGPPLPAEGVAVLGHAPPSEAATDIMRRAVVHLKKQAVPVLGSLDQSLAQDALETCRRLNGTFAATVAGGPDCQPPYIRQSIEQLRGAGSIVYLHPPGTTIRRCHFAQQDVVLAAWATCGLVPEPVPDADALATARAFVHQDRPLYAAPHTLTDVLNHPNPSEPCFPACNCSSQAFEGAHLYLSPDQLSPTFDSRDDGRVLFVGDLDSTFIERVGEEVL